MKAVRPRCSVLVRGTIPAGRAQVLGFTRLKGLVELTGGYLESGSVDGSWRVTVILAGEDAVLRPRDVLGGPALSQQNSLTRNPPSSVAYAANRAMTLAQPAVSTP